LQGCFVAAHRAGEVADLLAGDAQHVPGHALLVVALQRLDRQLFALDEVAAVHGVDRPSQQPGGLLIADLGGLAVQSRQGLGGRRVAGRRLEAKVNSLGDGFLSAGQGADRYLGVATAGHLLQALAIGERHPLGQYA
jgi:hypothetical protein